MRYLNKYKNKSIDLQPIEYEKLFKLYLLNINNKNKLELEVSKISSFYDSSLA